MTEKKTFKNPAFVSGHSCGSPRERWEVHYMDVEGESGLFKRDEYDMEVTFTKKVAPIEVGQSRTYKEGTDSAEPVYVVAICKDAVWVTPDPEDLYSTSWVTKLEWVS